MSIPLDSLVGELHVVSGARQSTTPATEVFTAPRRAARGRADDVLYVLADLSGNITSADLHALIERVSHAYWSTPGSVTAALRMAVTASGEWLMDHNAKSALEERWTGGLVCAVLRGTDAYLAQAGATLAFITQHGSVEQYPVHEADPLPLLGTTRSVEMRLAHAALQPGDTILLCDPRFSNRASPDALASTLSKRSVDDVLKELEQLAGSGDLIALVARATLAPGTAPDKPASAMAAATIVTTAASAGSTHEAERAASTSTEPPLAAPSSASQVPPGVDSGPIIRIAGRPSSGSRPKPDSTTAAPKPMGTGTPYAAPLPVAPTAPQPTVTGQPRPVTAPVTEGQPKPPLGLQFREWVEALRQSARRSAGSVSAAGQLVAQRTLPDQAEVLHKKELEKRNNAIMLATAIAIPVLVALLITVMTMQHGEEAAVATHLGEAQNAITLAQGAVTGTDTRKYYAQAVAEAKLALAGAPDNEQGKQLLEQAQTELDKIDNVVRLTPTVLWDFKSPGPQHLTAQGNSLYAADRSTGRISRMVLTVTGDKLDGDPETLLNAGVAVNGQLPGELIDIVAMKSAANRQASDIIIPHAGGLLDYNPSFGMKTLDFGSNALAPGTKRVRSYEGNLYVLDPAQNQIWRYKPNGEGFPNPAERYLAGGAGLPAQATDMAIDGNVYVTTAAGQILKYTDGQTGTFQIKGLGQALQQPGLVTVDPNAQDSSVYVVDQATSHVVQFRPDGLFVRQFRADGPAFDNIQDLVVDEQNNRLYVISKGVLYTALLPSLH